MNRILLLIAIAGVTFVIILFASRPELLSEFWLWIVGLAGAVVKIAGAMTDKLKEVFTKRTPGQTDQEAAFQDHRTLNIDESKG